MSFFFIDVFIILGCYCFYRIIAEKNEYVHVPAIEYIPPRYEYIASESDDEPKPPTYESIHNSTHETNNQHNN
tara:strand:- start:869 stop:1087 length:219 start_codon:yes stop_codon:yes gene_type:complete